MDKLEGEYLTLRKLGQKLHIPVPEAFWELEVRDKHGNVIQRHKQRSHSWTRNAYNLMFSQLDAKDATDDTFGAGLLSWKKTDGNVNTYDYFLSCAEYEEHADERGTAYQAQGYLAPGGEDAFGIIVGSGTDAESFEDYNLQTQIVEGSGAGQLNHAASELHDVSYDAGTKVLKDELVRYFNNNSGGSIDVNEVGLVMHGSVGAGDNPAYRSKVLVCRDKLASTVTVPDTGQLKVTYTIQLTYPA
jgi:hypothetical protein